MIFSNSQNESQTVSDWVLFTDPLYNPVVADHTIIDLLGIANDTRKRDEDFS